MLPITRANVIVETENGDDLPPHQRGHTMFMHSNDVDIRYAAFNELGRTDKSVRSVDADPEGLSADASVKGRYAFHLHRTGVDDQDDPAIAIGNTVWGSPGWALSTTTPMRFSKAMHRTPHTGPGLLPKPVTRPVLGEATSQSMPLAKTGS